MKRQIFAAILCGLFMCGGHLAPCSAVMGAASVEMLSGPSDSQLSAMFSQVAPQLSTQLQRVVTVGELHEGYGNGVVKVYYRGVNQDGLEVWEVLYGGGVGIASLEDI